MDSRDLTPAQANAIGERLIPLAQILVKWSGRMIQREFPPSDPLRVATNDAVKAVADLAMRFGRIADPHPLRLTDRPTEGERRVQSK